MTPRFQRYCEEPFRIFFPLGILASIIGVLLWPLSSFGWLNHYPLESHARWMISGFGGCMAVGFLGTAGPRLMGASPWTLFELLWHGVMALAIMILLLFSKISAADLITGFWLIGILLSMLGRLLFDRTDIPPPGMVLAGLGILTGAISSFALSLHSVLILPYPWLQFWRALYFQGFLWLPILGIAPYLLPRFFGRSSYHSFPESRTIPQGWLKHWLYSLTSGLLFLSSFPIEIWWSAKLGHLLRAIVPLIHLGLFVPGLFSVSKTNALAWSLRWIPLCAASGWLLASSSPLLRIGVLHLMFVSGFGILILAVATRVILGHHDRHDRLATPLKWYHLIWSGLLLTAATRLSADYVPKVRTSHLGYAAALWVIVLLFWVWKVRNELRIPEATDRQRSRCPRRQKKSS